MSSFSSVLLCVDKKKFNKQSVEVFWPCEEATKAAP